MARTSMKDRFSPAGGTGFGVVVEAWPLDEFGPESLEEIIEGLPGGAWDPVEGPTDPSAEAAEGFSALGDAVWSPWGSIVRPWQLPGERRVLAIVDAWLPSDPQFTIYSDATFPLASPDYFQGVVGTMMESLLGQINTSTASDQVRWAGSDADEAVTRIAASILDSEVSNGLVQALMAPMAFLGRRMNVSAGGLSGSFPIFDPFTTPTRRAIRRYRSLDRQESETIPRMRLNALDSRSSFMVQGFVGVVGYGYPEVEGESTPDGDLLRYEDIADRPFNPVIGTLLAKSPFMQGFWRTGGVLGVVRTLLAPDRTEPEVACFPLNWTVNNRAEFLPTYLEWLQWFDDRVEVNGGGESRVEALQTVGLAFEQINPLLIAIEYIEAVDGKLVVMVPEVSEVLLGDLLSKLTKVSEGQRLEASDIGDALRGGLNLGGLLVLGPLLIIPWQMFLTATEEALAELDDAVDEVFQRLAAGLVEAVQTGRDGNDALGIALSTGAAALEPVMDWTWKPFWKRERNAYSLGLDEGLEEKVLLDMGRSDFQALMVGLLGTWLDDRLNETVAAERTWDPTYAQAVVLSAQRESVVPVMMLDPGFFSWSFDEFRPWDAANFSTPFNGRDIGPWVEAASPLLQLVVAIDTASALLEAGVQAESLPCAVSGLATGADTLGQQVRKVLSIVGMESLAQVLPDSSVPRFIAVMWRQAMVDRLLLDLQAGGLTDLSAVYEAIPWMRSETDRFRLDRLLGSLDTERGGRRWEDGFIGLMGGASAIEDEDGVAVEWSPAESLDGAWDRLTAAQRALWGGDVAVLLDRSGMTDLRGMLATSSSTGERTLIGARSSELFSMSPDRSVWTWKGP